MVGNFLGIVVYGFLNGSGLPPISRLQHARLFELRAAMSMARLWQRQGKPEDVRRLLEEISSWFTEGFDTFDLQEAAKLLRNLV